MRAATGADRPASTLWIMLLTLASTATTLVLACATPFTALAALAATQMRARDGVALMVATWATSQLVGFCVLDYPRDAATIAWGAGLGSAAIAAVVAARLTADRLPGRSTGVRLVAAYLAAAAGFKLLIVLWSLRLGGVTIALSPSLTARQLVQDGVILAGLYALARGAMALGLAPTGGVEAGLPARRC